MYVDNMAVAEQILMVVTNGSSCPKFSVEISVSTAMADNKMIKVKVNEIMTVKDMRKQYNIKIILYIKQHHVGV